MFDVASARRLLGLLRFQFEQQRDDLNALDAAVGDGDHGFTMARAFSAAELAVAALPASADLGQVFDSAAQALAEHAGGAIGPLLAAFFAEGGLVLQGRQAAGHTELAAFFSGGQQAVQEIGGARPGDKTLIDALEPASRAFAQAQTAPLGEALALAAQAAFHGAAATQNMLAAHGRAHFLGERARGYQDAGATSMAILIQTFGAALSGEQPEPRQSADEPQPPPPGKLINQPEEMIRQDMEGLALAYPALVRLGADGILVRAQPKEAGKVGLAIGHGGGHTPAMGGFVGHGLLDADACGPVFTCASGVRIARAIAEADRGAGVALLVSNHSGDVLNARLAARRAQQHNLHVTPVLLGDDIATASRERLEARRGLGGMLFALKIGGAAAEEGQPLEEVARLMRKTNERTATLAAAVRPPTHPATGKPLFALPEGEIEVGTGVHGEVGVYRGPHMHADELIDLLIDRLAADLAPFAGSPLLVFLNGSGGTSRMELHILYRRIAQRLQPAAGVVDSFFTTQEMGGFSLSLCAVDDELLHYWNQPASAPAFRYPID
jgi:dihydroxyacetone kinase-like protein